MSDDFTPSMAQIRSHYVFDLSDRWDPERGEAFDRALAAHDAEVRGSVLAVQGEPDWEYGTAVREPNGEVWDHEFFTKDPITAAQLREWNEEHAADGWDDSVVVAVRRSIPRVEVWLPVEENGEEN